MLGALLVALALVFACGPTETLPETAPPPPRPNASAGLRATYLANEGVLLEAGETRIIIDGLHRPYEPEYATLAEPARNAIEHAAPPWEGIDLLLVSHRHGDHFHPEAVGRHLARAPGTLLVSSAQVADELASNYSGFSRVSARVTSLGWAPGRSETRQFEGAVVTFFGLSHGTGTMATMQNFGHLIEIGGSTALHVGDAEPTAENFAPFNLPARKIDVAFLPWWFLVKAGPLAVVRSQIAPKRIVAVHIGPAESAEVVAELRQHAPDAVPFVRPLEDHWP
jgi:L-ascorbate metabolism protein UlaG (beta-lactamase superfamily)